MQSLSERHWDYQYAEPDDAPVRYSLRELRATLLDTQKRLAAAHGGFARYQVLGHVFTLVASADASRRMFVEAPGSYPRGRQYDNLALLIGRGIICAEGADWQRQRKLVQPVFDKALMTRVVEITGVLTTQLLTSWDQARERGDQVDLLAGRLEALEAVLMKREGKR